MSWLVCSSLEVINFVCHLFVMVLDEGIASGSVAGCIDNKIIAVVSVTFRFFTCLVNWMISNRLLDVFLVAFWVPWTHFF